MTPQRTFQEAAKRKRDKARKAKAKGEARAAVAPAHEHGAKQRWCIHCGDLGTTYPADGKLAPSALNDPEQDPPIGARMFDEVTGGEVKMTPQGLVNVTTERLPAKGAPEKRGVLDSPTLRDWIAGHVWCQLEGQGYCACTSRTHRPVDPHHVASRGAHGRQDVLVVALCREAHDAVHGGHVPTVEVEAAAYRTQRAFWLRAPSSVRRKALQEMMEGLP